MDHKWIEDVISYWFEEVGPQQWFVSTKELDTQIRERFSELHAQLSKIGAEAAALDGRMALASVIVLDQFPRNMYRGTGKAFSSDDLALAVARKAVEKGLDAELSVAERGILYMPYMHSENLTDQEHAVKLFQNLGKDESLRYAIEHRDIVARFGRFPHRNQALGRESSVEEKAFLKEHAGYGQ